MFAMSEIVKAVAFQVGNSHQRATWYLACTGLLSVSCVIGGSALVSMDTLAAAMLTPRCDYNITHLKKQEGQMNNLTLFCCGFYHNKKNPVYSFVF